MKKITILLLSLLFFSCGKEDFFYEEISTNVKNKTLSFGEEFIIKSTSSLPLTYTSENDYHATVINVDKWNNAVVKAGFIGETTIIISNSETSKKVNLNISPQVTLYPTPPFQYFGHTKEELKNELGEPNEETENSLKYNDYSENATYINYIFNNNSLKDIVVKVRNTFPFPLNIHLRERYRFSNTFNDINVGSGFAYFNNLENSSASLSVFLYAIDHEFDAVLYRKIDNTEQ